MAPRNLSRTTNVRESITGHLNRLSLTELPPLDDPRAVPSGSLLYRRINPDWYIDDGQGYRVTSQAFHDLRGSLSVALGVVLEEMGLSPDVVVESYDGFGLVSLSTRFVRSVGLGVVREPTKEEPWHGGIYGKKTGRIKSSLAKEAIWLRRPRTS